MLKSDLVQTDKHSIKILLAEKSPIFTSHKSYKKPLPTIMKKPLILLIIGILLANCANNKTDPKTKTGEVVETIQSDIKNLRKKDKGTFNIIDNFQEILLKQTDEKCGEWGGDTEEIRIYKLEHNGKTFADYKKTIIDCGDPYSQKNQPKIIVKKAIVINDAVLKLAQESINELIDYKLTKKQRISNSGIWNYVISRDSTLIIEDWPSFKWPKFRELTIMIENK